MQHRKVSISREILQSGEHLIKEINLQGASMYWDRSGEIKIPTSLWESTKDLEHQIFEAIDIKELKT
jgi:hypothetical protein